MEKLSFAYTPEIKGISLIAALYIGTEHCTTAGIRYRRAGVILFRKEHDTVQFLQKINLYRDPVQIDTPIYLKGIISIDGRWLAVDCESDRSIAHNRVQVFHNPFAYCAPLGSHWHSAQPKHVMEVAFSKFGGVLKVNKRWQILRVDPAYA
ncbi:MAG: hypothetical protein ACR2HF_02675 [Methylococcaceae bacterium]